MDTVERGEVTEKELDAMIRRRHDKRTAEEGERQAENVETIIPPPEQASLTPLARVAS